MSTSPRTQRQRRVTLRALVCDRYSAPADVLRVAQLPGAELGGAEVLVGTQAAGWTAARPTSWASGDRTRPGALSAQGAWEPATGPVEAERRRRALVAA